MKWVFLVGNVEFEVYILCTFYKFILLSDFLKISVSKVCFVCMTLNRRLFDSILCLLYGGFGLILSRFVIY